MFKILNLFKKFHVDFLKKSEKSFFDDSVLSKYSSSYSIEYLELEEYSNTSKIIEKIHESCEENVDYIILLKDSREDLKFELHKSIFIGGIDVSATPISNAFISSQITTRLKQFNLVKANFISADEIELMRLPFLTFKSSILEKLRSVMITLDPNSFNDDFETCVKNIRKNHRKPMRRSQKSNRYFVDEKSLYFELGKELHARHETAHPHTLICDLNARYRFGCKIDPVKHYNVCNENSSSNLLNLNLYDCHQDVIHIKNRTHINVFSNDHIV